MRNEINKESYTLVQYIPEFYAHRMNTIGTKIVKIMLVAKDVNDDTRCLVYEINAPVTRRPVDNYKWNQRSNSGHVYGKMGDLNEHNCFILDSKNIFESIEDANKRVNQLKSTSKINVGDLVKLCGFHYYNPDNPEMSLKKNKLWIVTDIETTKHDVIMLTVENFGNHDNLQKTLKRIAHTECILISRSENHAID